MLDLRTERQTFIEVLDHESQRIIRMVRSFPVAQFERRHADCGMSAHDLVTGFVRHARRLESLAKGPEVGDPFASARTRGGLLLEYELAVTHVRETLAEMPAFRWSELMPAPRDLAPWDQGRRGELMWLALREMSRHARHFARHLRESDPRATLPLPSSDSVITALDH